MSKQKIDDGITYKAILSGIEAGASAAEAAAYVRKLERAIGLGFHPDNRFADYVSVADGSRTFTESECRRLEEALRRAWAILDGAGMDIYMVGWDEARRLLRRGM